MQALTASSPASSSSTSVHRRGGGAPRTRTRSAVRFAPPRAAAAAVRYAAPLKPAAPIAPAPAPSPAPAPAAAGEQGFGEKGLSFLQRAAAAALDAFESGVIANLLERPRSLPRSADPAVQIAGNFAPVGEQPPVRSLPVSSRIPPFISGVYVRNGANPCFEPAAGHHLFDGDGMVHAVRIRNGAAESYACRFTETARLRQERALGRAVFPKAIGELHGHSGIARLALFYARGLCGLVDPSRGTGVANAGLVYFNGRLLAMSEDDLPYQVRVTADGDLRTVGRYDFDGQLARCASMIAHPKLDPDSGELFALSYDVIKRPYLRYFYFRPDGTKSDDVEIPLAQPTMIHDFAITERFRGGARPPGGVQAGRDVPRGSPWCWTRARPPASACCPSTRARRVGDGVGGRAGLLLLPPVERVGGRGDRGGGGGRVLHDPCRLHLQRRFRLRRRPATPERADRDQAGHADGRVTRRAVLPASAQVNLEVGMVNRGMLGRRTRYAYLAVAEPWPKVSRFAKVDLATGDLVRFDYGEGAVRRGALPRAERGRPRARRGRRVHPVPGPRRARGDVGAPGGERRRHAAGGHGAAPVPCALRLPRHLHRRTGARGPDLMMIS
ncbi:unnamed protein product [Miscanthus lutarioriparius]|uniref:9-cis-epoxycarotenoid dioxygenase n=1 Tax=Miscanthus lutarioriparius TaxID=422564 RepID=A0A811RHM1_9POAL|nr:unnamed protein product [Miscanthus lutarioriparius]